MTKSKYPRPLNKKPKLQVKFDSDARREFLSGFHKRKLQKKAFYKSKLEKRLALEKQRIRAEAKKAVGRVSSSHSILPEVERIIGFTQADLEDELKTKSESFVLGSKTVTISSLDDIHTKLPPLGENEDEDSDMTDDEVDDHAGLAGRPQLPPNQNIKSMLKRTTTRLLQQSKAFKASQRFKQRSKKSRGKNRLAKSNGKGVGAEESVVTSAKSRRGQQQHSNSQPHPKSKKGNSQLHPKSKKGKRAKKSNK